MGLDASREAHHHRVPIEVRRELLDQRREIERTVVHLDAELRPVFLQDRAKPLADLVAGVGGQLELEGTSVLVFADAVAVAVAILPFVE